MNKKALLSIFAIIGLVGFVTIMLQTSKTQTRTKKSFEAKKRTLMAKFTQEIQMTKDPSLGYVPHERLLEARSYTQQMVERQRRQRDAVPNVQWENLGPNNVGGRTRALMFDPNDSNNKKVFAGAVSGGLWKNDDITLASTSWVKIDDFMDNITVSSLCYDPQNTNIFYAGTGEAYSAVSPGMGVFMSTDAGETWSPVPNTSQFKYVTEVLMRVEGMTSVLYVASRRAYVGEPIEGSGSIFLGENGLYRSADQGATWTQVIPDVFPEYPYGVDDIGLDNSGNLWVATGANTYGDHGGDIFKCSDGTCDVTTDFTKMYNAPDSGYATVERTVLALAPDNSNYLYAVAANNSGHKDIEFFIKSIDGGTSWDTLNIPLNTEPADGCIVISDQHFTNNQGTYDLCMTVHPTDENLVLLGGIDVYRTLDGFSNTTHVGSWVDGGVAPCLEVIHADHHTFVYRPGHPNEVIFGNDGGVYYSTNAGNAAATPSFSHRVKEYNVSQLYAADLSPTSSAQEYIAGLQDNGTQEWDGGSPSTTEAFGGDGGFCHIDQNQPNIQIAAYVHNDYGVTTDDWASGFTQVSPTSQSGRFINPTDYDDMNNILYAASGNDRMCRVLNIGTTNDITDSLLIGGAALGGKQATTFKVDPNTSTTLYVATDAGKIYKILNANGGSLTSTDISTGLPTGWISSIDVEIGNSQHMILTISSYGVPHIWETINGGASWTNIQNNFPDMPVRSGIFAPGNADQIFLGTDLGVWSTEDINGASTDWAVTNAGLANVRVDMLKARTSDNHIVVATFGRGLYTFTLPANPCPPTVTVADDPASGTYAADNTVSTNTMGPVRVIDDALFRAGNAVELNQDFEVGTGATFEAKIAGCPEED